MKILCYGDSNTYGYDPRSYFGERYPSKYRWPEVLAELSGWEVLNQGMNGRALPRRAVPFPDSADTILFMLGTNDLLKGKSASETAELLAQFLNTSAEVLSKITVIVPPSLRYGEWVNDVWLMRESAALAAAYRQVCGRFGVNFIDTSDWEIPLCYDGVHFTEEGHVRFAQYIYDVLTGGFEYA